MLELPEFIHERFDKDLNARSIIDLMTRILEQKISSIENSISLSDDTNTNNERLSDAMFINNSEESEDSTYKYTTFGRSSQTESQLSTARLAIMDAPNNNEIVATSTYYKHALLVFDDMMNLCKSKH